MEVPGSWVEYMRLFKNAELLLYAIPNSHVFSVCGFNQTKREHGITTDWSETKDLTIGIENGIKVTILKRNDNFTCKIGN